MIWINKIFILPFTDIADGNVVMMAVQRYMNVQGLDVFYQAIEGLLPTTMSGVSKSRNIQSQDAYVLAVQKGKRINDVAL